MTGADARPPLELRLTWERDLLFSGEVAEHRMHLDGNGKDGVSPVQALGLALASCMGTDIALILTRGRHPMRGAEGPPRRAARARRSAPLRERRAALRSRGSGARGRGRASDRALARQVLLGLALPATGHRVRHDVCGRLASRLPPRMRSFRCLSADRRLPGRVAPVLRWGIVSRRITQRELRNESGRVMRALDKGKSFIVTRNGVAVGELIPLRQRAFVLAETVLAAFAGTPRVSFRRFRKDLDALAEQDPTPRG